MHTPFDRTAVLAALSTALPYVRLYRGRVFVVKLGGAIEADPGGLRRVLEQVGVLSEFGMRVVVVHGGGPQATALAGRLGLAPEFVEGRRRTPPEMLGAVVMAINGEVNTAVLAACRALSIPAVGISGIDAGFIRAHRRAPVTRDLGDGPVAVDYGEVGDIDRIDGSIVARLLAAGFVPVVSPLAADDAGTVLNVNADTVAASLAAALDAEKLIFVSEAPGILENVRDPHSLVSYVDLAGLEELQARGVLSGGMLPKVGAARSALAGGVRRVHIVGHQSATGLLAEIFTNEGSGTLIVRDRSELLATEQQPSLP